MIFGGRDVVRIYVLFTEPHGEIINVSLEESHLYYCERSLIIDNDSGISNLFISPCLSSQLTQNENFDIKIYSFSDILT
jgi:hypothetical protein